MRRGRLLRSLILLAGLANAVTALAQQSFEIPADTLVNVRLRQLVSSHGNEIDQRITVEVIAPVEFDGRILVPIGARIYGSVEETRRVGVGLSREVAHIDVSFDTLEMPDGAQMPMKALVAEVDNSRETVDEDGRISGIRASASLSSTISGMVLSIGFIDPMLLGYTASSALSAFRIPESEIILPPGSELQLRLVEPLTVHAEHEYPVPRRISPTPEELDTLRRLIRDLPFRTTTPTNGTPSDLTNLLFIGDDQALAAAFSAAGWAETHPVSGGSVYGVMRSIVENQGYQEAPMSTLLLAGAEPRYTYAKTLDTFFSRHHLRIFARPETFAGAAVWTASSTQDIGIGFATNSKIFIHLIDEDIDAERDKIMHDLVVTGCVDAVQYVERPWVPLDAHNATGDALLTDGRIAVIKLNECVAPQRADEPLPEAAAVGEKPNGVERFFRDFVLMFKNSAFRGNIIYQGYWGVRLGIDALAGDDDDETPRIINFGGQDWAIVPGPDPDDYDEIDFTDPVHEEPSFEFVGEQLQRDFATRLEFSLSGGYMRFANDSFSTQEFVAFVPEEDLGDELAVPVTATSVLRPGWNFALKTTLNSHMYFSHEFGYTFNSGEVVVTLRNPFTPDDVAIGPANIRQFSYNMLLHARPNGARVRPYAAIGPALQIIRVSDPLTRSRGIFRFAFKEVGIIFGAWNFGSLPPFEGGGIFQPALQYGGGVKIYLSENWLLRADFRETLSAQPDFWTKSYDTLSDQNLAEGVRLEIGPLTKDGPLRHQVFTIGVGFAF
jgi:hypothetical protein